MSLRDWGENQSWRMRFAIVILAAGAVLFPARAFADGAGEFAADCAEEHKVTGGGARRLGWAECPDVAGGRRRGAAKRLTGG